MRKLWGGGGRQIRKRSFPAPPKINICLSSLLCDISQSVILCQNVAVCPTYQLECHKYIRLFYCSQYSLGSNAEPKETRLLSFVLNIISTKTMRGGTISGLSNPCHFRQLTISGQYLDSLSLIPESSNDKLSPLKFSPWFYFRLETSKTFNQFRTLAMFISFFLLHDVTQLSRPSLSCNLGPGCLPQTIWCPYSHTPPYSQCNTYSTLHSVLHTAIPAINRHNILSQCTLIQSLTQHCLLSILRCTTTCSADHCLLLQSSVATI